MGETYFTKRKGILLVAIAPILFLLSGLFLANTLVYPAGSIPYLIGQLLCFVVAPILFIAGIIMYTTARRALSPRQQNLQEMQNIPHRLKKLITYAIRALS